MYNYCIYECADSTAIVREGDSPNMRHFDSVDAAKDWVESRPGCGIDPDYESGEENGLRWFATSWEIAQCF